MAQLSNAGGPVGQQLIDVQEAILNLDGAAFADSGAPIITASDYGKPYFTSIQILSASTTIKFNVNNWYYSTFGPTLTNVTLAMPNNSRIFGKFTRVEIVSPAGAEKIVAYF
jgi:hypothetical protein